MIGVCVCRVDTIESLLTFSQTSEEDDGGEESRRKGITSRMTDLEEKVDRVIQCLLGSH